MVFWLSCCAVERIWYTAGADLHAMKLVARYSGNLNSMAALYGAPQEIMQSYNVILHKEH